MKPSNSFWYNTLFYAYGMQCTAKVVYIKPSNCLVLDFTRIFVLNLST